VHRGTSVFLLRAKLFLVYVSCMMLIGCRVPLSVSVDRHQEKYPILICDVPLPFYLPNSVTIDECEERSVAISGSVKSSSTEIQRFFIAQFDQAGWQLVENFASKKEWVAFFWSARKSCCAVVTQKKEGCVVTIYVKTVSN
jgi:hypothetical protein